MENSTPQEEMKNLVNDIRGICHDIVKKPNIQRTDNDEEYNRLFEKAKKDTEANQEIVLEEKEGLLEGRFFYSNLKEHISFHLFKELRQDYIFTDEPEETRELLQNARKIIKENDEYFYIQMKPGDINLCLSELDIQSNISKKISTKIEEKHGAWILGEDCFIKKNDLLRGKLHENFECILPATQSDLIAILEGLKKLL